MSARSVPAHFDAARVGDVWRVDYARRADDAEAWAHRHAVRPAARDRARIVLLLVDCQNTFCIPGFELFVGGRSGTAALDDNVRLCEFLYRNLSAMTEVAVTMDTHLAIQIFHPVFWIDEAGRHPTGAATVITVEDVERGVWKVNPEVAPSVTDGDVNRLTAHALHYVRSLAARRYPLMIWPYHAMLGGIGHALVSAVEEAVFFHSIARETAPRFEVKGDNPLTEHYSVLSPEVLEGADGRPIGRKNDAFIDYLLGADAVIVAGQAKSHCVAWTVSDLLSEIRVRDPGLARKVYLLEDCTSPVVVPGVVDFTDSADAAFRDFSGAGMRLVRSTDPIDQWPGWLS